MYKKVHMCGVGVPVYKIVFSWYFLFKSVTCNTNKNSYEIYIIKVLLLTQFTCTRLIVVKVSDDLTFYHSIYLLKWYHL